MSSLLLDWQDEDGRLPWKPVVSDMTKWSGMSDSRVMGMKYLLMDASASTLRRCGQAAVFFIKPSDWFDQEVFQSASGDCWVGVNIWRGYITAFPNIDVHKTGSCRFHG